jgi:alkanesulfonate monooxygenase SsuD/methylene tetrahydromethanopterin reductase-like flavin-dependent oxidoreductase (luciferase family)
LAYAAMVYTAPNEADARAGAEKLLWYITSNKVPPHFANPPGYVPVHGNVAMLRGAEHPLSAFRKSASVEGAIEAGIMFAGTPDQVYRQMKKLYDHVGGFGHLLIMGQAGFLEHDETVLGIRTFARELYPRLKDAFPDTAITG